jgi:hypothetical protein
MHSDILENIDRQTKVLKTIYSVKGQYGETLYQIVDSIYKMYKRIKKGELEKAYDFNTFIENYNIFDRYTYFSLVELQTGKRLSLDESAEKVKETYKVIYLYIILIENTVDAVIPALSTVKGIMNDKPEYNEEGDDSNGMFDDASDDILSIVNGNLEYLTKKNNLPQLGFLMWTWENVYHLGRIASEEKSLNMPDLKYQCGNNPKYEIEDGYKLDYKNEEQEDIVYSAWSNAVDEIYGHRDENRYHSTEMILNMVEPTLTKEEQEFQILSNKVNKTMDEWIQLLTDKRYEYSSLYPDEYSFHRV